MKGFTVLSISSMRFKLEEEIRKVKSGREWKRTKGHRNEKRSVMGEKQRRMGGEKTLKVRLRR